MAFRRGLYRVYKKNNGGRCHMSFDECEKCGHEFEHLEKIWKRYQRRNGTPRIAGYLCESCYDGLFIDL